MSVEHRRQLLAFSIVALAAVLMIGNGMTNQALRDAINGGSARQAAIASGVSLVPGQTSIELGGSARGTTAVASDSEPTASGARAERPGRSRGSSAQGAAVGQADRTPNAKKVAPTTKTHGPKRVAKSPTISARTSSDGEVTDDGTKVHAKKGTKAHGKKAHGKKNGKSRRHAG